MRREGGLSQDEDIFAPVSAALRNRWKWLAINLFTAFIASRVIHGFRESITLLKLGRDPAFGSSMSITAWTDSGGFFIFLALATVFLLR
ncbi:hypothetical protein ACCAA_270067 [Candidatus Accumulibacter aalborgensis]|uniref:Uncharacterized protein n=1 Tax=Candidatus Accumulibacter aalborgensis TaxID=1860102 RepID=A0A1A8XPE7_9PROT|nr:hypothetical protein ACCAA_270067 [Candidatus Accumulibacter aalborgensis]